ncbi:S1 family peptidase [Amycolatopsis sp. NPDC058986]|uniref:S1 family peptidase n=1 Tax=unclassified Amycolatopsis TaxID=2618356 RepID=UPI00366E5639
MSRRFSLTSLFIALTTAILGLVPTSTSATADDGPITAIVGGRPASEAYPFMVYVGGCTGSLIKANWAITAKHCPTPSSVRVGSNDRTSGGTVVRVTRGVSDPRDDVKLLQLANSVPYAPIPVATDSGPAGTPTRILGWGQTCPQPGCGSAPRMNQELDTSIVADQQCGTGATEICTDNPNSGGDCYGDSGGPQIKKVNGVWQQIGTDSAGTTDNCGEGPSIYVDIASSSVRTWISQQVGGL